MPDNLLDGGFGAGYLLISNGRGTTVPRNNR